jgi:hypothetical protein
MKNIIKYKILMLVFGIIIFICSCTGEDNTILQSETIQVSDTLEIIFYGDSCNFQGPTTLKPGTYKLIFINNCNKISSANLVRHDEGYSHQDMTNLFVDGYSEGHHPNWTTEVQGIWNPVTSGKSHTWTGNLHEGLYTLVCAKISPFGVWYGAGLTVIE